MIVDSSREPLTAPADPSVTVVPCAPGTGVARKRNMAVEAARGTLLTWFDDDDWQHPRRLSMLAAAAAGDRLLAGPQRSWFVDLRRRRARPYQSSGGVIFNGLAVRREALDDLRFDERRARAADTAWVASLRRRAGSRLELVPELLFCWLCHDANLSNPVSRHVFPHPLSAVSAAVGAADWGDSCEQLARLRERLVQPGG